MLVLALMLAVFVRGGVVVVGGVMGEGVNT